MSAQHKANLKLRAQWYLYSLNCMTWGPITSEIKKSEAVSITSIVGNIIGEAIN